MWPMTLQALSRAGVRRGEDSFASPSKDQTEDTASALISFPFVNFPISKFGLLL